MIKRVLLAVDDSAASLAAARMAAELCAGWGATLHVVTAVSDEPPSSVVASSGVNHGSHEARVREAQALLRYVAQLAARQGVIVETEVVGEQPAVDIVKRCRKSTTDLVVIGRSGRSGFGQPYIGSYARHILEFAEVPVVVVPPPG